MMGKLSWYNLGGLIKGYQEGGAVAAPQATYNPDAGVQTGIPQGRFIPGGYASPAIENYFGGAQTQAYSPQSQGVGQGVQGSAVAPTTYQAPLAQQQPVQQVQQPVQSSGGGAAAVPAAVTNQAANQTYGGETYDTSQDVGVQTGGTAYDEATNIGDVSYSPEELAAITTDISQSSLIPTEQRIADNQAAVNQTVAEGGGNISAGPAILDASQVGANVDSAGSDDYHKAFQSNYNANYDHAQANPTGQTTGVPLYDQGFDFSDAGIDSLLPPTASEPTNTYDSSGNIIGTPVADGNQWGFTSFADLFDGGGAGASGDTYSDGIWGDGGSPGSSAYAPGTTEAGKAAIDQQRADTATQIGAATADRGSRSVRDQRQAELRGEAGFSESAEDVAAWRGLSYPEKEAAIAKHETETANLANIAKANAMFSSGNAEQNAYNQQVATNTQRADASGLSNLSGSAAKAKLNELGLGNFAKEDAADTLNSKINDGSIFAAQDQQAKDLLAQGVPAEEVRAIIGGHNMGGPIGRNVGGAIPGEDERTRRASAKIAQSKATATPIKAAAPLAAGQIQKKQNPLAGFAKKAIGGALTGALGPIGGLLGGLFNEGGEVDYDEMRKKLQAKNQEALAAGAQGQTIAPATRALFDAQGNDIGQVQGDVVEGYAGRAKQGETEGLVDTFAGIGDQIKAARAAGKPIDFNSLAALQRARQSGNTEKEMAAMRNFLAKNPSFKMPGGSQGVVLKNQGGMIGPLGNPRGYNEGGQAQAMPIKKVMDMEKLESQKSMDSLKEQQAERAFMMGEERKADAHKLQMQQKQEAHTQAMKLKKDSATMKAPLAK